MNDATRRPGKFVWFQHLSGDPRAAQAFYEEVLGWRTHAWGDYAMILAGEGIETMIGGYGTVDDAGERPRWMSYVSVDDVDAAAERVARHGGELLRPPRDLPGAGRVARVADPQGAELCLFRKDGGDPPDGSRTSAPPPRIFFWNELHTTDPKAALAFYAQVLGYTHETMSMGDAGDYHVLSSPGGPGRAGVSGHLGREGAPAVAPHWLPYVSVDDPDATLERARRHGGKIHVGPLDIPGIGRFGVIEDPTGAALAVMKAIPPQGAHAAG